MDDVFCLADIEHQVLIDEYTSRYAAEQALARRISAHPEEAGRLAILSFDASGRQLGAPISMPPLGRDRSDLAR